MPSYTPTLPEAPALPRKERLRPGFANKPSQITKQALADNLAYQHQQRKHMAKTVKPEGQYVCAFVSDSELNNVLLIRKLNPPWQRGKLNGVGGKIEEKDVAIGGEYQPQVYAMRREWLEETGVETLLEHWQEVVALSGKDRDGNPWLVHFFKHREPGMIYLKGIVERHPINDVGERFELVPMFRLYGLPHVIPNLRWLVPLSLFGDYLELPLQIQDVENQN